MHLAGALSACLYLAALWYAAPACLRSCFSVADRLRTVLLLGIAAPLVLAAAHALYAPLLWAAVAILVAFRVRRGGGDMQHDPMLYAMLAATLLVTWPPLVRPLLDGDTLLYHLPIAATFVQTHSMWTASAPYWTYPSASEAFASAIFCISGRWSLPLAGILPALLLAARLYDVARRDGAAAWTATSVPLAFLCMPLAAFQAGTMQNDLWLAAFAVEILAADRTGWSIAVCTLLKPFGFIEALIAAAAARIPLRTVLAGAIPVVLWGMRDAVLLAHGARVGFSAPPYWASTIAGNFSNGIVQVVHGIALVSPQAFFWLAVLAAGWLSPQMRPYALAGSALVGLYVFLPLSYGNGPTNYVVDASSVRFALSAFACGALIASRYCMRAPVWMAIACYTLAAWGAWSVLAVFWNDGYTHWALLAAVVGVAAAFAAAPTRGISVALAALALIVAGRAGAESRAAGFYANWMPQPSGEPTGIFAWVAHNRPVRIAAANVRIGAVMLASPQSTVIPVQSHLCARAKQLHALLLVGSNEDATPQERSQMFNAARSCGRVLYADGAGIVVSPG